MIETIDTEMVDEAVELSIPVTRPFGKPQAIEKAKKRREIQHIKKKASSVNETRPTVQQREDTESQVTDIPDEKSPSGQQEDVN